MRWQLPTALIVSALMLSGAAVYGSMNDHRSRWCGAMVKQVAHRDLTAAGDLLKRRTVIDWSDEELGYGLSIEECRVSLWQAR